MELDYLTEEDYMDFYRDDIPYIEKAMELTYEKIKESGNIHFELEDRNPVEHIKYRVKHPESAKRKLEKLNYNEYTDRIMGTIKDICGFRIVCTFISDVKYIVDIIKGLDEVKIIEEKDYIDNPKENGYRSYHIIFTIPIQHDNKSKDIFVEAQIRTIAMDCWASLEHQLMYKKDIDNKQLFKDELKKCADEMATTDLNLETIMSFIKDGEV